MSNHLHLIAKADEGFKLSEILRDFKKYTSKQIVGLIQVIAESRKEWMLHKFEYAGKRLSRISKYKFWKDDNHAIILDNGTIIQQKLYYTKPQTKFVITLLFAGMVNADRLTV
jgi:REP element-mobilizing transposase RayT